MPETPPYPEPPIARPEKVDPWAPVVEALKAIKGEWRKIDGDTTTASTNIERGVIAAFRPAGSFEAHRLDGELYVRYLGTPAELDAKVATLLGATS